MFIHSAIDGWIRVNKAAVNMDVQASLWDLNSFGYIYTPRGGSAGSDSNSSFNFWRTATLISTETAPSYKPTNSAQGFQFLELDTQLKRKWAMYLVNEKYACVLSHSVVSDSLWPHGLEPARLLCPGDSPGKDTGVGSRENVLITATFVLGIKWHKKGWAGFCGCWLDTLFYLKIRSSIWRVSYSVLKAEAELTSIQFSSVT